MGELLILILVALASPVLGLITGLRLLFAAFTNRQRAWTIALAWDDLMNVISNGWFGQTISYRAATAMLEKRRWGCVLCRWLDIVEKDHCAKALTDHKQNLEE